MIRLKTTVCRLFIIFTLPLPSLHAQLAVVIRPVIDLCFSQLSKKYPDVTVEELKKLYREQPLSVATDRSYSCLRGTQALFNEVIDVLLIEGEEAWVGLPHLLYHVDENNLGYNTFWTLREDLFLLPPEWEESAYYRALVASQPAWKQENRCERDRLDKENDGYPGIVTLILSGTSSESLSFSAGTRFVRYPEEDTRDALGIMWLDHEERIVYTDAVPRHALYSLQRKASPLFLRSKYVQIIRRWIQEGDGAIPYVWGGNSVLNRAEYAEPAFSENVEKTWTSRTAAEDIPRTGIDCSSLILRAAQLVGIPYWYKLSDLLEKRLPDVPAGKHVQEGDILWFHGHVMIVGDKQENTIIESSGYGSGYGNVHEIPLHERFHDITTYDDLEALRESKGELVLLTRTGNIRGIFPEWRLLDFCGVWKDADLIAQTVAPAQIGSEADPDNEDFSG